MLICAYDGERKGYSVMQRITEDIKTGQLKQIYLLYGDEGYLVRQYRDRLSEAMLGGGDKMNVNCYEGKGVSVPEIIDMAETLPFFADRRVIILENTELFKSGGEKLAEYLKSPAQSSSFIISEREVDKRSGLYKTIKKYGYAAEFGRQDAKTLQKWVLGILKKEKKQISAQTLSMFLEGCGDDMENIRKELEKLLCYTLDREVVTEDDVKEICVPQIQNHIFDMIEAIAAGNSERALRLYYDLLALREPPMRILALIGRQFNMLLQVKELAEKGYPQALIAEKVGLHGFVAGKYMKQAAGFKMPFLKQALEDCVKADYDIKSGRLAERLSVELLIVKYGSRGKERT